MKTASCDKLCDNIKRLDLRFVMHLAVLFGKVTRRIAAFCEDPGQPLLQQPQYRYMAKVMETKAQKNQNLKQRTLSSLYYKTCFSLLQQNNLLILLRFNFRPMHSKCSGHRFESCRVRHNVRILSSKPLTRTGQTLSKYF